MSSHVVHIEKDPIYKLGKAIRMLQTYLDMFVPFMILIPLSRGSKSKYVLNNFWRFLFDGSYSLNMQTNVTFKSWILSVDFAGRHHVAALAAHADELERLGIRVVVESCQGKEFSWFEKSCCPFKKMIEP